jgi:hypothetical protein
MPPAHPRPHRAPHAPAPPDRALPARKQPRAPATLERRRRERHLQRRRRDLLVDCAVALLLMIVALVLTAGLGVIALLDIPVIGVLIGSLALERWMRSRHHGRHRAPRRS